MERFPCAANFGGMNRTWTQPGGCTRQGARDAFPRLGEPAPGSIHIAPFRVSSLDVGQDPNLGNQVDLSA